MGVLRGKGETVHDDPMPTFTNLNQYFSTRGDLDNIWRYFGCHNWEGTTGI